MEVVGSNAISVSFYVYKWGYEDSTLLCMTDMRNKSEDIWESIGFMTGGKWWQNNSPWLNNCLDVFTSFPKCWNSFRLNIRMLFIDFNEIFYLTIQTHLVWFFNCNFYFLFRHKQIPWENLSFIRMKFTELLLILKGYS